MALSFKSTIINLESAKIPPSQKKKEDKGCKITAESSVLDLFGYTTDKAKGAAEWTLMGYRRAREVHFGSRTDDLSCLIIFKIYISLFCLYSKN